MVDDDRVTTAARVRERRLALGWDTDRLATEAVLPVETIEAIENGDGRSPDVSQVASALSSTLGWLRSTPPDAMVASRPSLTPDADDTTRARYRLDEALEEVALDAGELVEAGVLRPAGSSRTDGTRAIDTVRAAVAGLDDPGVIEVAAALGLHVAVRPVEAGAAGLRAASGVGVAVIGSREFGEGTHRMIGGLLAWWLTGDSEYHVHDDTAVDDDPAAALTDLPPGAPDAHWARLYEAAPDGPRAAYRRLQRALRDVRERKRDSGSTLAPDTILGHRDADRR